MKRVRLLALVGALVSLLIGLAVPGGTGALAQGPGQDRSGPGSTGRAEKLILGTWATTSPNPAGGPAGVGMETFTPDGGVIRVGSGNSYTFLGSWEYLGRGRFAKSLQGFVVGPDRDYQARIVVRSEFTVIGDMQRGHSEFDVYTPDGTRVAGGEGPFKADRYAVERLD